MRGAAKARAAKRAQRPWADLLQRRLSSQARMDAAVEWVRRKHDGNEEEEAAEEGVQQ